MDHSKKTKQQLIAELTEKEARLHELESLEAAQRETLERVNSVVNYDNLTGLPNRSLFWDRLRQSIEQARRKERRLAVLFLSLDRFKLINDTMGASLGDLLLKEVARRLDDCLRKCDTLARPGRDEFMLLLNELNREEDTNLIVERIFESMGTPFQLENHELMVTASIGISFYPGDADHPEALISHAYTAMIRAKEECRNNCQFYSPAITSKAFNRLLMENSLRLALKRDEFILHYQPQIDLASNRVVGLEALVRWSHPEHGPIPPEEFISLIEEIGLIIPLSEWVLHTACRQIKSWHSQGFLPLRVAVNISTRELHQKDLVSTVGRVLDETGLPADGLELEITEGSMVRNVQKTKAVLHALNDMGVGIAVDDFGTGYSSLSYLSHFPLSRLKIDRSFIHSLTEDRNNVTISKAIVALAHSLRLKVIAEGVETGEQLEMLRALGTDEGQGFLLGHPLPADDTARFLQARATDRPDAALPPN